MKPIDLAFNNGKTWKSPDYSGLGGVKANWKKFFQFNNQFPTQTTVKIDSFYSDIIELVLEAFGPDPGPSSIEPMDSVIILISFRPQR